MVSPANGMAACASVAELATLGAPCRSSHRVVGTIGSSGGTCPGGRSITLRTRKQSPVTFSLRS